MNWFFHKVYWTKWIAHHHTRRRVLIGGAAGQMLGLVILGFTSVFREGGETVLFLQASVLDAGTAVVIQGWRSVWPGRLSSARSSSPAEARCRTRRC